MITAFIMNSLLTLPSGLSEVDRIKRLAPYFDPPPGEEISLTLSPKLPGQKTDFLNIKGHMMVSPPKGKCLLIKYNESIQDFRICSPSPINFFLKDLGPKKLSLNLTVVLPDGSDTRLSWPTPHSLGRAIRTDLDTAQPLAIHHCWLSKAEQGLSILNIKFFDDSVWTFRMPKPSETKRVYDANHKNLIMAAAVVKGQKVFREIDLASGKVSTVEKEIKLDWDMRGEEIFETRGARLTTDFGSVPNKKSICRYQYGSKTKPDALGEIECHSVAVYQKLFLPLKCLVH